MPVPDLVRLRNRNQLLARPGCERPEETVAWFGAMQAQDYPAALWAVGLRTRGATERSVEQAIVDRSIVRTWPLRGTLHFVAAEDVRWMQALLTPPVVARARRRFRELELDDGVVARSKDAVARALAGGRRLTRPAMRRVLEDAGIDASGQRGYQLLWRCAQEGLICPGPREGKQHTFVLLDEWVPPERARPMGTREEALAELARTYFRAHGPATLRDFTWWSGLPAGDARTALELARSGLESVTLGKSTYWLAAAESPPSSAPRPGPDLPPHLLPAFDEYLVGYTNRDAVLEPAHVRRVNAGGGLLGPTVALDGRIAGRWKRTLHRNAVSVDVRLFAPPPPRAEEALAVEAAAYGRFLGLEPELSIGRWGGAAGA